MKRKAIRCLALCALPAGSEERHCFKETICKQHSEKAIAAKLEELTGKGYIEYGTSVWGAWLTQKGEFTLAREVQTS